MKKLSILILAAALSACCKPQDAIQKYHDLAKEAYVYAFPAVEHNKVIWSILTQSQTPANKFLANTALFTYENTTVVSPNNDTFYSYAVCDLRHEPVVISISHIENRYFSLQLNDIFTNCPDYISTLATGEGPGNYMLASTDWDGNIPSNIDKVIRIPATVVLVLARTQVFGLDDAQAGQIARSYQALPLSQFAGTPPPSGEALSWPYGIFDAKTGGIEAFFKMFNNMVQYQILNDTDKALMKKYKAIGLGAGEAFSKSQFDPEVWAAIEAGATEAKVGIEAKINSIGSDINGWNFSPANAGRWGTDYGPRAAAAWKFIYVNTPEEAIYATGNTDSNKQPLTGSNKYTISFTPDQIPQVAFFWSLTMYNDKGFLAQNAIGRYNIKGDDKTLVYDNGSLTLYIQKENPGEPYESNWLPAPDGQFYMILRMYGPSKEALEGSIIIPAIVKTSV